MTNPSNRPYPDWIPKEVQRYLEHIEGGCSIRQLARNQNCHPSTVLRQIRRVENRRDDPLVSGALNTLAQEHFRQAPPAKALRFETQFDLESAALEVLARLCLSGAVLAVAEGMEKAVVVKEGETQLNKLVIDQKLAGILALLDWIVCTREGRLRRYHITATGRAVYNRLMASRENQARTNLEQGFGEARGHFEHVKQAKPRDRRSRYGMGETPLDVLARLQDKSGTPFLPKDLVDAGKRLREDYELAQVGEHLAQNQLYFYGSNTCGRKGNISPSVTSLAAKKRAAEALAVLGAGLSDIALRCCCHLEGLEAAERQLGWSARSGKIVLRIALSQLKSFYDQIDASGAYGQSSRMIG